MAITTLSFDIAVLELLLPLVTGAEIVLASRDDALDGGRLIKLLDRHAITLLQATPATWRLLLAAGWRGRRELKMLCGGEALPRDLAAELLPRGAALWNMYGPTETTVWSAIEQVTLADGPIAIGCPIDNTQLHVLDSSGQPLPIGVIGELWIGGAGVARGYRSRPELTAERFVPDRFSADPEARLYRTGDLARRLADGRLECLGRTDQQIKLRGFRIELGEIESALRAHPAIREAAVQLLGDSDADRRLVGYVALVEGAAIAKPSVADLQAMLRLKLPDYMIPAAIVTLAELPRTPNGKLDRRALESIAATAGVTAGAREFVPPRTPTEHQVARLWQEVLELPTVGIHDDFFRSGGHSLRAAHSSRGYGNRSAWKCRCAVCSPPRRLRESPRSSTRSAPALQRPQTKSTSISPPKRNWIPTSLRRPSARPRQRLGSACCSLGRPDIWEPSCSASFWTAPASRSIAWCGPPTSPRRGEDRRQPGPL